MPVRTKCCGGYVKIYKTGPPTITEAVEITTSVNGKISNQQGLGSKIYAS
jgi:hypothetical protein